MNSDMLSRLHFSKAHIESKYLPISGPLLEIPEFRTLPGRVLILCSSRTGSEFLSYLLEDFGILTFEYLNIEHFIAEGRVPQNRRSLREYLTEIARSTGGRVLGIKGTGFQTLPLFLFGELPKYAGEWQFVHARRRNIVQQAVSLLIAKRTGAWNSAQTPLAPVRADDYSFSEIARCIDEILLVHAHNERILAYLGVGCATLYYEDLRADPRKAVEAVGQHLGRPRLGVEALEGRGTTRPPPRPQSTDINREWEARFRSDAGAWRLADEVGPGTAP